MMIVVTGGAGYLGSVLCSELLRAGHSVRIVDDLLHGGAALLPVLGDQSLQFFKGDVRNDDLMDEVLHGADAVVHLAAIVGDPACARHPELAKDVNYVASRRLAQAAASHGVSRFLFASTCSNYGRMTDTGVLATEDHELRPVSLYAETKVAVENMLLSSDLGTMCPIVYRFATLYGLSPRMRFDLTVNQFAMEMLTQRQLTVFGEQFWRPYVHVRDAARAIITGLQAPTEVVRGQVYNIGSTAENYRKSDIIALVQERLTPKAKIMVVPQSDDPRDYRVSFDKVQRHLGFHVTRTVPDGIDEVLLAVKHAIVDPQADTVRNVA